MDRWLNNVNVVRVAAILLGVLLWLVVRLNYEQVTPGVNNPVFQTDTIVDAKVTAINLDSEQYYLNSIEPAAVDITVEGMSSALNRIPSSEYAIIADLAGLTEGTHQVPLIAENFPSGVDVTLQPDTVTVTIERMETKQFDVIIELTGSPEDGLNAGVPVVNPARVHATVPEGRLNEIHSIRGQINVQGASDTFSREVILEAYDASGRVMNGVTISPSIVSVEVPINPPLRSVPLQISFIGRPQGGLSVANVRQDADFVTIYGPQETIDAIDFYEGVTVDLSTITEDTTLTLEVPLIDRLTNVEPGEVQVAIDVEPTVRRTFEEVPIRLFGDTGDYEIEITDPEVETITLTVSGAPELVNRLTAGDVQVILDVSNIAPGNYVLPLRVNLPRFIGFTTPEQLRASVTVTDVAEETEDAEETSGTIDEGDTEDPAGNDSDPDGGNSEENPSGENESTEDPAGSEGGTSAGSGGNENSANNDPPSVANNSGNN